MRKKALITGITGQDGSYLADLLLTNGYEVHGIKRRTSVFNTQRIDSIYESRYRQEGLFHLHHGDMTDSSSLLRILQHVQPDEIYNLAAQSHVMVSFEEPEYTANSDALGALRLLEAIRILGLAKKTKYYQASTSELYGLVQEVPQNERTPFYPRSPYAIAKLYAYWITINYREAYGIYACNGILFNHESPVRGETFVSRNITRGLGAILNGRSACLKMGNLDAKRAWGHAKDYVEAQYLMLQQRQAEDLVIATGMQFSVRNFIEKAAEVLGITLQWEGQGREEVGRVQAIANTPYTYRSGLKIGQKIIEVSPRYFRPTEVESLLGDASKAKEKLGWTPKIDFPSLVREMTIADFEYYKKRPKA